MEEKPLAEITLRKYETPYKLGKRELAKKICLSLGLLQTSDNRDVIVADGFIGSDPYSDSLFKDCKGAVKICKFTKNGYTGYDKIIFE